MAKNLSELTSVFITLITPNISQQSHNNAKFTLCAFEIPPGGHIHQYPFSGPIDSERLALFIDMRDHLVGMLDGIHF